MVQNLECAPLPIFRPSEQPATETDCAKDQAARKLYEDAAGATARVDVSRGTGSGFFIGDGSRVVTNAHVVNGQYSLITIRAHNGQTYKARIEKLDDINDLAILKLEDDAHHGQTLNVTSSQTLKAGDNIYGLGHPRGSAATYISPGIYEDRYALKHTDDLIPKGEGDGKVGKELEKAAKAHGAASENDGQAYIDSERLQMLLRGQPGSSGGAILNESRQVVGILANGPPGKTMANNTWSVPSERLQALMDPGNNKFSFNYQDISLFRSAPVMTTVFGAGTAALVLGLPRVGGTAVGALSLFSVPGDLEGLMNPQHSNDRLYYGMSLASTAGFVAGAALSYFPRARIASRVATSIGLAGFLGQTLVPRYPYLQDVTRTDGEKRPPFLWDS